MKKILLVLAVVAFAGACSTKNTRSTTNADGTKVAYRGANNTNASTNSKDAKYQIIDQEFDNLLAPGTDYDNLSEYELQACGATYLPPQKELKTVQPKTEVVVVKEEDLKADTSRKKKVTNTTNIYYMDGPAPQKVSSTSTTTVTSSSSSSSSSSGTGTGVNSSYTSSSSSSTF